MLNHARNRLHSALLAAGMGSIALAAPGVQAQELVYGSWVPAGDYLNSNALPTAFKQIEAETNGAIKWKLIPGGQIADGKTTFTAVKDGLMQAGLGIPTYVPNLLPSNCDALQHGDPGRRRRRRDRRG